MRALSVWVDWDADWEGLDSCPLYLNPEWTILVPVQKKRELPWFDIPSKNHIWLIYLFGFLLGKRKRQLMGLNGICVHFPFFCNSFLNYFWTHSFPFCPMGLYFKHKLLVQAFSPESNLWSRSLAGHDLSYILHFPVSHFPFYMFFHPVRCFVS